jgi:hypothetical protein
VNEPQLSVEEAIESIKRSQGEWCLLAIDLETGAKTYSCRACYLQRITLVTPGAVLPARCPKCDAVQTAPDPNDPAELQCADAYARAHA